MDEPISPKRRYTVASLVIADHPYFEGPAGGHAHLVLCRACLSITLEAGDIVFCQACQNPLFALEKDLILHLATDDWELAD
jgi:hypothetical protein